MRWSIRKTVRLFWFFLSGPALLAQQADSMRVGIHAMESAYHRWDVLKVSRKAPELRRGAELARQGDIKGALKYFKKALPKMKSASSFNLGVIYFETGRFSLALKNFQASYKTKKDSVCLQYLQQTKRLLQRGPCQK